MPLNGVMLMKQAGVAERRLRQPHGQRRHCSARAWPRLSLSQPPRAGQAAGGNLGLLRQRNGQGSSQEMKADQVLFPRH